MKTYAALGFVLFAAGCAASPQEESTQVATSEQGLSLNLCGAGEVFFDSACRTEAWVRSNLQSNGYSIVQIFGSKDRNALSNKVTIVEASTDNAYVKVVGFSSENRVGLANTAVPHKAGYRIRGLLSATSTHDSTSVDLSITYQEPGSLTASSTSLREVFWETYSYQAGSYTKCTATGCVQAIASSATCALSAALVASLVQGNCRTSWRIGGIVAGGAITALAATATPFAAGVAGAFVVQVSDPAFALIEDSCSALGSSVEAYGQSKCSELTADPPTTHNLPPVGPKPFTPPTAGGASVSCTMCMSTHVVESQHQSSEFTDEGVTVTAWSTYETVCDEWKVIPFGTDSNSDGICD